MTYILGISAFYHDSAATLIKDGEIIAAAQEERFSRKKHDSDYPHQAIEYVLSEKKLKLKVCGKLVRDFLSVNFLCSVIFKILKMLITLHV